MELRDVTTVPGVTAVPVVTAVHAVRLHDRYDRRDRRGGTVTYVADVTAGTGALVKRHLDDSSYLREVPF